MIEEDIKGSKWLKKAERQKGNKEGKKKGMNLQERKGHFCQRLKANG